MLLTEENSATRKVQQVTVVAPETNIEWHRYKAEECLASQECRWC